MSTRPRKLTNLSDKEVSTEFLRQNTQNCITSIQRFKGKLLKKLFNSEVSEDSSEKKVNWPHVYKTIKTFGIHASETMIWNVLLTPERAAWIKAEEEHSVEGKVSEMFRKDDFTDDVTRFLFHMTESYKRWKKPVTTWKKDLYWAALTQKFLMGNGCNFLITMFIVIMTILLLTLAAFPIGEGIFDTSLLSKVLVGLYGFGCFWYFGSLLGENWYPWTYGGLVVNLFFFIASFVFLVLFAHLLTPGYYEKSGCFECPSCSQTEDKLCFTYNHIENVNHVYSEANTCSCALKEELRISEPLIPYGESEKYCGGDDCSCATILSNSQENWILDQEYYSCVYFSPKGLPLFFFFGSLIIVLLAINTLVTLFSCVYLIMMCLGCGRGDKNCICCGINFSKEQEEASAISMRSSTNEMVSVT